MRQAFFITEAGKMTADGAVARDADAAQVSRHSSKLRQETLENEGKAYHQRLS
jgi:hypothetical protein